jgi:para-nitrobenzyl esterase
MRSVLAVAILAGCAVDAPETLERSSTGSGPVAFTTSGWVRGTVDGGRNVFRGIPYAAPPVGERRFRDPAFARPWLGVRDAVELGPLCPQITFSGEYAGEEDCLRLNVYAPAGARPWSRLPVLVWIHGGGGRRGSAHVLDRMTLPLQGMVVVTIHYRLNILGSMVHPALSAEQGSSGQARVYDQAMALLWTKLNIASFGGDPRRVLVAGQSSGGWDTQLLLGSRAAGVLFDRAASVSASDVPDFPLTSLAEGEAAGVAVAERLGCAGAPAEQLACLRALPAQELVEDDRAHPYSVPGVIDGRLFPEEPTVVTAREGARVPFLIGSTREEILDSFDPNTPEDEVVALFHQVFGDLTAAILPLYPFADYPTPGWALAVAYSDRYFACVDRHTTQTAAGAGGAPVYRYLFAHALTDNPNAIGAYHRLDIGFILGDIESNANGPYTPTAEDLALSNAMMASWRSFAATGHPGAGWPAVGGIGDESLHILASPIVHAPGWHVEACQLQRPL